MGAVGLTQPGKCPSVADGQGMGYMSADLQALEKHFQSDQAQALNAWFDKRLAEKMTERENQLPPSMSIMVTKENQPHGERFEKVIVTWRALAFTSV